MKILVLYYSRNGSVRNMAHKVAYGVEKANCEAILRTVPPIQDTHSFATPSSRFADTHILDAADADMADSMAKSVSLDTPQDVVATLDDLRHCDGLAVGSPARFGNMAAPMKLFWESTSNLWLSGSLIDKPATVFTSSSSMHGGNESTLLTMMLPLLHHGMLIQGLPYSEPSLNATTKGGTPYGASHVAGLENNQELTADESELCIALGFRLAQTTQKLNHS